MIGIYMFTNKITGESYIGQSTNIKKRYEQHKNAHNPYSPRFENTYFHDMLYKYGFDNFCFTVLDECEIEELDEKEIYYIALYKTQIPNGYNILKGGNSAIAKKLDSDVLNEIINDLKNSNLKQEDIASKYGLDQSTISEINNGKSWKNNNIDYPIRKVRPSYAQHFYCKQCGKEMYGGSKNSLCLDCYLDMRNKKLPSKTELLSELCHGSFESVARHYSVTSNAVRKWCDKYGLSRHSIDYKNGNYYT